MQLELPAGLNHGLGAVGVALARQLHNDFVFALAVGRDERLGQSQRVDAPADGILGLRHGLLLDGGHASTASS